MSDGPPPESDSGTNFGRRTVLQGLGAAAGTTLLGSGVASATESDDGGGPTYELPPLPYDYDALEPHVDARIMELHHDSHHQGYVDGANAAVERLAEMRASGDYDRIKHVERDLSFNLSGHVLHSIFWENMSPEGGGRPRGSLGDRVAADFGSFERMREQFAAAASSVEGSGWGALLYDHRSDSLLVTQVEDHNDLAVQGSTPILVLDVWEHAYYLQYENRRSEYVDAFWNVVDWADVKERYEAARGATLLGES